VVNEGPHGQIAPSQQTNDGTSDATDASTSTCDENQGHTIRLSAMTRALQQAATIA